jgi:hypothetical protein
MYVFTNNVCEFLTENCDFYKFQKMGTPELGYLKSAFEMFIAEEKR